VALLVLLAVLRWKAPQAGPVGLLIGVVVALAAFRTPLDTLAVAGGKGVWDAVFILAVVWPALLLYRVTDNAGAFQSLRRGIATFSDNRLFVVLGFGWIFASFLQGIAGFGTPIAVVAPLLVAIGVRPIYAVVIPLIGHAWANMFGTLAVGWLATLQVIDLGDETETAFQTAIMLWIPNLAAGFAIAWLFGHRRGVMHALPLVLIVSGVHGGVQLALTLWNPVLSNFLAATAGLLLLYPLSRWKRYSEPEPDMDADRVMQEPQGDGAGEDAEAEAPMGLGLAIFPYLVLTLVSVVVLVIDPVEELFEEVEVGLPFPAVDTGYDVEEGTEDPYSPITFLTHPGAFLLVAAGAAWLLYRARGYYERWSQRQDETTSIPAAVVSDAVPSSVAVVSFLVLSKVMDHSGQTESLALGIAEVAPPALYTFLATWIGVLGAFMTSSNTASNVLFASLQQTVADTERLTEATIIGAQSTGGAIGNAIAPANVVLGTGTAGIVGQEGQVLRRTLPWAVGVTILTGGAALLLEGTTFT
jgi:lactate permease